MPLKTRTYEGGIQIPVVIQPRASKNEISGIHNGAVKIRLTAPPVEGAANRMCVKFLAKWLGISPSRVHIVSGLSGKSKTIQIEGMEEDAFHRKLAPVLSKNSPKS